MEIKIRKAVFEDCVSIQQIMDHTLVTDFPEYSDETKAKIHAHELNAERMLGHTNLLIYVAEICDPNRQCAAFISATMPIGGVGDIHWLLVDKRFQGKGIGRQLVDAYIKDAKKHGAHAIHLYSSEVNTAFYEKLGFEKVGLVRKNYWGSDDYFMNLVMT